MKLYYYDHCPFCVRALMAANYKQVDVEKIILLNDDAETCIRLVGAKQVPILEFDDGTAMPESLDIAQKFDEIGNKDKIIYPKTDTSKLINDHIVTVKSSISSLLYPRNIKLGLPEYATKEAIAYFKEKKEKTLGKTFEQAWEETDLHKSKVEEMLQSFPPLPNILDNTISWDDILIFPTLRNLTMVKGLNFPQSIKNYIDRISEISMVSTYEKIAI